MSSETLKEAAGVVDVHAHFVTPWYVEAALAAGHVKPDGMPGWPSWSVDDHLRLMDESGVQRSVLSISSPGVHFGDDVAAADLARRVNDFAAEVCEAHPDRFGFFASTPLPDVDAALAEIERATQMGADGVVVETNIGGTYVSDPSLGAFWDEVNRRGTVVFMHPTSPPSIAATNLGNPSPMMEFLFDTTRVVASLILRGVVTPETGTRLIVTHCGAFLPLLVDRLELFAALTPAGTTPPAVMETTRTLWFDLAGTPVPTHANVLMQKVGSDHLLFGSDYCWTPAPIAKLHVDALDEQWDGWRDLVGRNAAALWSQRASDVS